MPNAPASTEAPITQALLDKHRYANVEHFNWWDHVEDCLIDEMRRKGFTVNEMYFSGFSSQGDGACFTGYVSNWTRFLVACGLKNRALVDLANRCWQLTVHHSGPYYHSHSIGLEGDTPLPEEPIDEEFLCYHVPSGWAADDIRAHAWCIELNQFSAAQVELAMLEFLRGRMGKLYRNLEEEYTYLTSDELVEEYLRDNPHLIEEEEDTLTTC